MTGKITRVEFTFGSVGNQWTYIQQEDSKEPVKYATWWDFRDFGGGIQVGATVEFTVEPDFEWYYGSAKCRTGPVAKITNVLERVK